MSELGVFSTFKNSELDCSLTTIKTSNDDVCFFGNEFTTVLGYTNPQKAIRDHVDESDKFYFQDIDTGDLSLGSELRKVNDSFTLQIHPHTILITESGAYCLILKSKLPAAKKFTKWVTKEVLPTIRKTGTYTMPEGALPKLDTITTGEISELKGLDREKFRYKSLIKSNLAKDLNCVARGTRGGTTTQERWRNMKTENEELKEKTVGLNLENARLKIEKQALQAELDEIIAGLEELARD